MPDSPAEKPAKPAKSERWSVRATNHTTGETWAIDDTKAACESELDRKLSEWAAAGEHTHTIDGPIQIA